MLLGAVGFEAWFDRLGVDGVNFSALFLFLHGILLVDTRLLATCLDILLVWWMDWWIIGDWLGLFSRWLFRWFYWLFLFIWSLAWRWLALKDFFLMRLSSACFLWENAFYRGLLAWLFLWHFGLLRILQSTDRLRSPGWLWSPGCLRILHWLRILHCLRPHWLRTHWLCPHLLRNPYWLRTPYIVSRHGRHERQSTRMLPILHSISIHYLAHVRNTLNWKWPPLNIRICHTIRMWFIYLLSRRRHIIYPDIRLLWSGRMIIVLPLCFHRVSDSRNTRTNHHFSRRQLPLICSKQLWYLNLFSLDELWLVQVWFQHMEVHIKIHLRTPFGVHPNELLCHIGIHVHTDEVQTEVDQRGFEVK